jgi:hypothetical protein
VGAEAERCAVGKCKQEPYWLTIQGENPMSLKNATLIALIGLSGAFVLSLFQQYLFQYLLVNRGMSSSEASSYMNLVYTTRILMEFGALILFLAVLYAKQKNN